MCEDTIEEINNKIYDIKLLLKVGDFSGEIKEMYEARIDTWEAEIYMIESLLLDNTKCMR